MQSRASDSGEEWVIEIRRFVSTSEYGLGSPPHGEKGRECVALQWLGPPSVKDDGKEEACTATRSENT